MTHTPRGRPTFDPEFNQNYLCDRTPPPGPTFDTESSNLLKTKIPPPPDQLLILSSNLLKTKIPFVIHTPPGGEPTFDPEFKSAKNQNSLCDPYPLSSNLLKSKKKKLVEVLLKVFGQKMAWDEMAGSNTSGSRIRSIRGITMNANRNSV